MPGTLSAGTGVTHALAAGADQSDLQLIILAVWLRVCRLSSEHVQVGTDKRVGSDQAGGFQETSAAGYLHCTSGNV